MANVYTSADQLIGHTPLLELVHTEERESLQAKIYGKVEFLNPAGSVKDRIGKALIEDAERSGALKPGGTIIEPTSGNTGIGLASVATAKGYRAIIVMPETMSAERRMLIKAYGAELVLTDGSKGMAGAIAKAEELKAQTPGSIIAGQFSNPANAAAHIATTGPEIWEDLDGQVDAVIAGVGTGGTISGIGNYIRSRNPEAVVVAVEPATSPVLSQGQGGAHGIQGIGAGFVPEALDMGSYTEVMTVADQDAFATARNFGRTEGILIGISGGAAVWAAVQVAKRPEMAGKNIVVILPDNGERYLSTTLFQD